jgi:tetratricopeptide (TPR) repeat protein
LSVNESGVQRKPMIHCQLIKKQGEIMFSRKLTLIILSVTLLVGFINATGQSPKATGFELLNKAKAAEAAGKRNEALQAYTQAIQAGDLTGKEIAFAYYRRGSVKAYLGENVSAIEDYTRATELNPKMGEAFSLRGYLRSAIGQYDLAEKDHQTAVDLHNDSEAYLPWALLHYADLWRRRGDFAKALSYCEKALQAKGVSPSVYLRRAWIYLDMGRTKQAKADFVIFEREMKSQGRSFEVFWPDERGAISRLRELN